MAGAPLEVTTRETHLGLIRTPDMKVTETVTNNISKARRALYALMNSGVHGLNGLHPAVSLRLWHAYIMPRLTYGLEQLVCSTSDWADMEKFQRKTFRRMQHLPDSAANPAVLLLLGELPVQAAVDRQTLFFFVSILRQPQSKECQIMHRQLAVKDSSSVSWTVHVTKLLRQYDLPSPHFLLRTPPELSGWKRQVKEAVRAHWMEQLVRDTSHMISLKYLCLDSLVAGCLHPLWSSVENPHEIRQAAVKVKMITGTYWLQIDEARRRRAQSATCKLCQRADEDLPHLLLHCSAYDEIRLRYLTEFRQHLCSSVVYEWQACCTDDKTMVKLLLDPSSCKGPDSRAHVKMKDEHLMYCEQVSRQFLYKIHNKRGVLLRAMQTGGGTGR